MMTDADLDALEQQMRKWVDFMMEADEFTATEVDALVLAYQQLFCDFESTEERHERIADLVLCIAAVEQNGLAERIVSKLQKSPARCAA
jgi:hypothetical protein